MIASKEMDGLEKSLDDSIFASNGASSFCSFFYADFLDLFLIDPSEPPPELYAI